MNLSRYRLRGMAVLLSLAALASSTLSATACATAQPATGDHTHAASGPATGADNKPGGDAQSGMMQQMQSMQAMHAKVMTAKTPAERAALMKEHMALMQSGMSMMQGMHGTASAQRMDMMQMMMQMMMDRMTAPGSESAKPEMPK